MGRAPCICDENTIYVVQARNQCDDEPIAKRKKLLLQLVPGIVLILLVFALVQILESTNKSSLPEDFIL